MITVRTVENDGDIDTYLDVRNRVHPQTPMPREVVLHDRRKPDQLDLIAERDGVPVGAASTSKFGGAPDGEYAYLTMRVLREERRQGVGTALHRRASEHAVLLGKTRFYVVARGDDEGSLGYYGAHDFVELGRMQDVFLDLDETRPATGRARTGISIRPATPEHDRGAYEVALEADADIPSGEPIVSGPYRAVARPALRGDDDPRALVRCARRRSRRRLRDPQPAHRGHRRAFDDRRGAQLPRRGIALALKQAQIAAAKEAGLDATCAPRTTSATLPMRRVNEKLGYVRKFEWVHLGGPLLEG